MQKKALFVVTSNDNLGNTGRKTGWHLSEVSHVYWPLINAGFKIDFASPRGGKAPVDPESMKLDDAENKSFVDKFKISDGLNTHALWDINPDDYGVIYFAGGHGTMWDFPDNEDVQRLVSSIYETGGIVAAVCHGPSALLNVQLSDGKYLIENREINSFTDSEEEEVKAQDIVPFLLESKLRERGANFQPGDNWANKVVVDGRLITGQNPQSASSLGEAIVRNFAGLDQIKKDGTARMTQENKRGPDEHHSRVGG